MPRLAILGLVVLAGVGASAQQSAPGGQVWPPAGVATPGPGITLPRVVQQVKAEYTPDAMRRHIQGTVALSCVVEKDGSVGAVRVLQPLDPDLDEQAIAAVRQWRFVPARGTDGSPMALAVTVNLTFTLRDGPPPAPTVAWPAGFDAGHVSSSEPWITRSAEAAGLIVHITHPVDWAFQPYREGDPKLLTLQNSSSTELMSVSRPTPRGGSFNGPIPQARLDELVTAIRRQQSASARKVQFGSYGQVMISNAVWIWMNEDASTADFPVDPAAREAFGDIQMWLFATVADDQYVMVSCMLLMPRNVTPEQRDARIRQATSDFGGVMRQLSIAPR